MIFSKNYDNIVRVRMDVVVVCLKERGLQVLHREAQEVLNGRKRVRVYF